MIDPAFAHTAQALYALWSADWSGASPHVRALAALAEADPVPPESVAGVTDRPCPADATAAP